MFPTQLFLVLYSFSTLGGNTKLTLTSLSVRSKVNCRNYSEFSFDCNATYTCCRAVVVVLNRNLTMIFRCVRVFIDLSDS